MQTAHADSFGELHISARDGTDKLVRRARGQAFFQRFGYDSSRIGWWDDTGVYALDLDRRTARLLVASPGDVRGECDSSTSCFVEDVDGTWWRTSGTPATTSRLARTVADERDDDDRLFVTDLGAGQERWWLESAPDRSIYRGPHTSPAVRAIHDGTVIVAEGAPDGSFELRRLTGDRRAGTSTTYFTQPACHLSETDRP